MNHLTRVTSPIWDASQREELGSLIGEQWSFSSSSDWASDCENSVDAIPDELYCSSLSSENEVEKEISLDKESLINRLGYFHTRLDQRIAIVFQGFEDKEKVDPEKKLPIKFWEVAKDLQALYERYREKLNHIQNMLQMDFVDDLCHTQRELNEVIEKIAYPYTSEENVFAELIVDDVVQEVFKKTEKPFHVRLQAIRPEHL